jgi:hypothetical protein
MATYNITSPDGQTYKVTAPDTATEAEVLAYAQKNFSMAAKPAPKETTLAQDIKQGAGNLLAGAVRGAGSIGATLIRPFETGAENEARRKAMDEGLRSLGAEPESWMYQGGKLGGEIAGTAGAGGAIARVLGAIPGVAAKAGPLLQSIGSSGMTAGGAGMGTRIAGGAVSGGVQAAMVNPDDAKTGAMTGAAMPVLGKVAGTVGGAIGNQFKPSAANADLAKRAMDMGMPLGVADVTGGKFTKAMRSVLNDAPLTGGIGAAQQDAKQAWFNRAVGNVFDAADDKLTPEVMDAAKKKMGGEFDRIWSQNNLLVDNAFLTSLQKSRTNAAMLPKGERARITSMLDDLESQVTQAADGSMVIPGDVANRYQSTIRKMADSSQSFLKDELGRMRQDVLGAFNRSVSPEDAAALALNQKKYKAFKTVEPLLQKAEAGVAGRASGDVPASLLPGAVFGSYKNNVAGSPLADLSKIGSQFLVDRVPQTGGSARALIQNSAIGAALGTGMLTNPLLSAAVIPAAMGAQKALGSPALARSIMRQQAPNLGLLEESIYRSAPLLTSQ